MALRWALERIHSLEKELGPQAAGQTRSQEEIAALKERIAQQKFEADGLQLQYDRLKRLLAMRPEELQLAGKLNLEALNAKERELLSLQKSLEQRKVELELEQKNAALKLEEAAKASALKAAEALAARQAELEHECRDRLAVLPEREAKVKQQELDLAERQKRFEEYSALVRSQLEADVKAFKSQAEQALKLQEESEKRHAALSEQWARDKDLLVQELKEYRRKMRAPIPALSELERRLAEAEDELQHLRKAQSVAEQRARFAEIERESAFSLMKQFEQELPAQIRRIAELAKGLPQHLAELETEHGWASEKQELIRMLQAQQEAVRTLREQLHSAGGPVPPPKKAAAAEPPAVQEAAPAPAKARVQKSAKSESELLKSRQQAAAEVYGAAIRVMESPLSGSGENAPGAIVQRMLDLLQSNNQALAALTCQSAVDRGPNARAVNVAILSIHVGLGMRWDHDRVRALGLAALLGDVTGELPSLDSWYGPEQAAKHAVLEILAAVRDRKSGRAQTLRSNETQAEAQIIGLCGLYEAMIKSRDPSAAMLPGAAIKVMLTGHVAEFARPIMQAFIQRLTPFPAGSFVKLGDGEIACVIETHPDFPTRPKIEIQLKGDLTAQDPPLIIDLAENPMIQLRGACDRNNLGGH